MGTTLVDRRGCSSGVRKTLTLRGTRSCSTPLFLNCLEVAREFENAKGYFLSVSSDTKKCFRWVGWSILHCTKEKKTSRVPTPLFSYFGIFALRGTSGGEKRYPDQRSLPVPLFALVPPGLATVINTVKNNSLKTLFVRNR